MPWKSFRLVETVANDSLLLQFEVLEVWIGERAPPHAVVNFSRQRGTTIGTELQGLTPVALTGVIVQLVERHAAGVKVVVRVDCGPSQGRRPDGLPALSLCRRRLGVPKSLRVSWCWRFVDGTYILHCHLLCSRHAVRK